MMSLRQLNDGIAVFQKYSDRGQIQADHDIIYIMVIPPDQMAQHDCQRLNELGWTWDEEFKSWTHFT